LRKSRCLIELLEEEEEEEEEEELYKVVFDYVRY
jgi:hypothetical protein